MRLSILSALLLVGCERSESGLSAVVDTLRAEPEALIGTAEGAPEYLFGRIVGIAVDRSGTIYLADELGSSVRAYDRAGSYVGTVGSEGDGPGEFRYLLGLDFDPFGRLHVRGAFRLSVFEHSPETGLADSLVRTLAVEGGTADRTIPGQAGAAYFYAPGFIWEGFQRRGYFYLAYDSLGAVADTVVLPPFPDPESTGRANYAVSAQGGRNVEGINRAPFEPRPSWDISDEGHIWFTQGDRYEILELGPAGDTLAFVRRPYGPQPVPASERQDSTNAFLSRIDSVPVSLDEVRGMSEMARRRELPTVLPPIVAVQIGESGYLWVRRWPRSGTRETVFDIVDPSGAPDRIVLVPEALLTHPAPRLTNQLIIGVVEDPVTGVQRVGIFRLPEW